MTQLNSQTYNVQRTTGRCAFTEQSLEPGETYIATLVEVQAQSPDEATEGASKKRTKGSQPAGGKVSGVTSGVARGGEGGFQRVDVSLEAWEQGKRPEHLFSYWRTVVPEPSQKKKMFVDDSVLYHLFGRLADETQDQRLAFRFVLALILIRKKILRYDGSVEVDGKTWWNITPKLDLSKGPMGKWDNQSKQQVLDPNLDDDQIQQVTEQLGEILEAEIE